MQKKTPKISVDEKWKIANMEPPNMSVYNTSKQ